MLLRDIPNRILTLRAYRVVATTIKASADQLRKEFADRKESFPEGLEEALTALEKENQSTAALLAEDISLQELDRDTDHIVAAFRWLFIYWSQFLSGTDYKALPKTLVERLSHIQAMLSSFFPEGTGYLKESFKIQWTHLDGLKQAMAKPENKAHLDALGLTEESNWLSEWIDLYGSRAGITDAEVASKLAKLQEHRDTFQEVFDDCKVQVFAVFRDNKNPVHLAYRATLMKPYVEEVEKLRAADRKNREAKIEREQKLQPQS
jgi:hypothetical protein